MRPKVRLNPSLYRFAEGFLDLLYPRHCIGCNAAVEAASDLRFFCRLCADRLEYVHPPYCLTCGKPYYGEVDGPRTCSACRRLRPAFTQGRTLLTLQQSGRALIYELKYHQGVYLKQDIQKLLHRVPALLRFVENSILVPVPLHPRRLRERGYNQSKFFAQCLIDVVTGVTLAPLLVRTMDTASQTAFNQNHRYQNIKRAFAVHKKAALNFSQRYIVVDDVFTTGATLNACCKVLRQAGIKTVDIITLAHG